MKKNYFFLLISLFSIFYISAQSNLVPNGDMENWDSLDDNPTEWARFSTGIWKKSTDFQNGSASLELEINSGDTQNFIFSPNIAFTNGTTYVCTFYYKLVTGTFSKVNFNLVHKPGVWPEDLATNEFTNFPANTWVKGEFEFTATTTENIQVYIKTYGTEGAKILIDNVSVIDNNPIVNIPDANFKTALLNHSPVIDTNNDGEIQVSEAEAVTEAIYVIGQNKADNEKINDLTGIEAFINIENLFANNNKISTFNGSNLSKLIRININDNNLTNFNLANGKNELIQQLIINNNPQLFCIQLDADFEAPFETNYFWQKDAICSYNSSCDSSNVIDIPDPNFKKRLLSNKNLNTNQDNEVQYYEAVVYTGFIDVSNNYDTPDNEKISDLTGIEHFKKIINLYCSYNKLTQLDLSQNTELRLINCDNNQLTKLNFSKNIRLEKLSCNSNILTQLDLTGNTNLKELSIQSNNLSQIDLSKNINLEKIHLGHNQFSLLLFDQNIKLKELICSYNQLTQLDLSNNINLTKLNCENNLLTSLNIKNGVNELLETLDATINRMFCITVDDPSYSNTKSTWHKDKAASYSTNCSNITYEVVSIPDAIFKEKLLTNTWININRDSEIQLVEAQSYTGAIDVDNSYDTPDKERISDLTGIEYFSKLTGIYCKNNNLTQLDLSHNSNLISIECGLNKIKELYISMDAPLQSLQCYNNDLTELNLKNGKNNLLTSLDLQSNRRLLCVTVDDVEYAYNQSSWFKAPFMTYKIDCSTALTDIAIIPDEKFKEELLANTYLNVNNDNEIQVLEAERYNITLNVRNSYITNIAGIEYFTNLTNFNLVGTQIKNLDLSANTTLKEIYCRSNYLTNINIKNGNNSLINKLDVDFINTLTCIQVDSVTSAENNPNWKKSSSATYSEDCYKTAGIDDVFTESISLHPNPVEDTLIIETQHNQPIKKIQIFNTLGKEIMITNQHHINCTSLPSGVYLIKIESTDQKTGLKKFIKL
ncbi:T9SS type A sorting domain-containing protein [Tenacibaculum sp. TC6]|uniref:T9SS type A sorting domain-containing protein n=1 Tax=Tenacibaculum sp. TC6 TaxID=3423223 RepID=UPI003D36D153